MRKHVSKSKRIHKPKHVSKTKHDFRKVSQKLKSKQKELQQKRTKLKAKLKNEFFEIWRKRYNTKKDRLYTDKEIELIYRKVNPIIQEVMILHNKYPIHGRNKYVRVRKDKVYLYEQKKWIVKSNYMRMIKLMEYWQRVKKLSQWLGVSIQEARNYERERMSLLKKYKQEMRRYKKRLKRIKDKDLREVLKQRLDEIKERVKEYDVSPF